MPSRHHSAISPLAPKQFPALPVLEGVHIKSMAAGLRYRGRDDLCALVFDKPASIAGVFTQSRTSGAPIDWNRALLENTECHNGGQARAIIINAGNANAFTGRAGTVMCETTAKACAAQLSCSVDNIFLASTGVIGEKPSADYLAGHIESLLGCRDGDWHDAAKAIATTDTFAKGAGCECVLADSRVDIVGIAKGSGMIAPNMATMLSFIVTSAKLPAPLLQKALKLVCDESFNCVTVDGDCSTSDMVLLAAVATADNAAISETSQAYSDFVAALRCVSVSLARQIAADGEGAKKFITVRVQGAISDSEARQVALSIGNSPLVKTAIAGEDANWGRVVMAVGKSGAQVDRDKLDIAFGDMLVARAGEVVSGYDESPVVTHMRGDDIVILVDLHLGQGAAEIWTCDLTYDYIRINADYRS